MGTAENPIVLGLESEPDTMDDLLSNADLAELTDIEDLLDLEDPYNLDNIQIYDDWKWLDSWIHEHIKELFNVTPLGSRSNPIVINDDNADENDIATEEHHTTQVTE